MFVDDIKEIGWPHKYWKSHWSDLLCTNTHKGCCLLNANEYNYELRSVIGQEDESKVTK